MILNLNKFLNTPSARIQVTYILFYRTRPYKYRSFINYFPLTFSFLLFGLELKHSIFVVLLFEIFYFLLVFVNLLCILRPPFIFLFALFVFLRSCFEGKWFPKILRKIDDFKQVFQWFSVFLSIYIRSILSPSFFIVLFCFLDFIDIVSFMFIVYSWLIVDSR